MLVLGKANEDQANIRLIRFTNAGPRVPMRPGARAWDTGCYFSLMVRSRDMAYNFYTEVLGFATFYKGDPYTAQEPTPLGLPVNLTTTIPYLAGIVYPTPGEFGRMEMIEIRGLDGYDYADRCDAPNLGILAVRFEVRDATVAMTGGINQKN